MDAKVALVTGAARRVGAEIVRTLHAAGYAIMLHYYQSGKAAEALLAELNAERPGSAASVQADLREPASAELLVTATQAAFGRLDALIHNASSFYPTPLGQIREADWLDLMGSNLKAPLFLSQAAQQLLAVQGGSIVFLADVHAERPVRDHLVYSLAKSAVVTLTRALARDLGPGIRVNAVAPGYVLWPDGNPQFDEAHCRRVVARTPLGRIGEPGDVAAAVHFLLEGTSFISGAVLPVDGGLSASFD